MTSYILIYFGVVILLLAGALYLLYKKFGKSGGKSKAVKPKGKLEKRKESLAGAKKAIAAARKELKPDSKEPAAVINAVAQIAGTQKVAARARAWLAEG